MAYKDKEKQKESQREWVRQKRAEIQGSTEGSTKVTHPDVLKAAGEMEPHRFEYSGSYYYWNMTVREELRALPLCRIR